MARVITHVTHDNGQHEITTYHDDSAQIEIDRAEAGLWQHAPRFVQRIIITGEIEATAAKTDSLTETTVQVINSLTDQLLEAKDRAARAEIEQSRAERDTSRAIITELIDQHEQRYNDQI